jgi:hypothetical protein
MAQLGGSMKVLQTAIFSLIAFFCLLFSVQAAADHAPLPIRGIHLSAPKPADLDLFIKFIEEALPREGVNLIVVEINYHYKFSKRPEVADPDALSREDLQRILASCRKVSIQLIPMINCLGHQSWDKTTFGLLRSHPELDETPGKYPGNKDIYCRSYCPLHPAIHEILFDLIDELAEVCEAKAFHVGMDEVFLLGEDACPRCRGKNKAELFAGEVKALHDHLASSGRAAWIWGDRFLDGSFNGLGKWEASQNDTAPALDLVPRDIMICDWHYERVEPTAAFFAVKGFPVVAAPWRRTEVALGDFQLIRMMREQANEKIANLAQGVLQTTWCDSADFINAYNEKTNLSIAPLEAAQTFKTLFVQIRNAGLASSPGHN